MNSELNKALHAELTKRGYMDEPEDKEQLISDFTKGRTKSSRDLSDAEASELINILRGKPQRDDSAADRMRKKILSICHKMQWYERNTSGELILYGGKPKLDFTRIDVYCIKYSPQHVQLNRHTLAELPVLVTIFQNVLKSYNKKQPA